MDKPVKVLKSKNEIRRFFNNKIVNSEKVLIDGKRMYMTVNKIDDSGKEVKHKKNTKSKIREKRTEMNQTLNFPDINYKKGLQDLPNNLIENNSSIKGIVTLVTGKGKKPIKQPLSYNPLEGFKTLREVESYLFKKIESFTNPTDSEIIDIFHKIQCWGGRMGKGVYQKEGFDKNFKMNVYKDMVSKCLNFDLENDWVNEVSDWTFDLHKIHGINTSFSTKHIRFWLYKKLKENTPPIFDEVIQGRKDVSKILWIFGLNKYNQKYPLNNSSQNNLIIYWEQMIKKSKKEKISLLELERRLFNYFTIQLENYKKVKKIIKKIIHNYFKSEIKEFPDFDYLVEEIVIYINKYSVKEDYYEELIEFTFQGRNTPKYYGSMEEYLLENKFMFED